MSDANPVSADRVDAETKEAGPFDRPKGPGRWWVRNKDGNYGGVELEMRDGRLVGSWSGRPVEDYLNESDAFWPCVVPGLDTPPLEAVPSEQEGKEKPDQAEAIRRAAEKAAENVLLDGFGRGRAASVILYGERGDQYLERLYPGELTDRIADALRSEWPASLPAASPPVGETDGKEPQGTYFNAIRRLLKEAGYGDGIGIVHDLERLVKAHKATSLQNAALLAISRRTHRLLDGENIPGTILPVRVGNLLAERDRLSTALQAAEQRAEEAEQPEGIGGEWARAVAAIYRAFDRAGMRQPAVKHGTLPVSGPPLLAELIEKLRSQVAELTREMGQERIVLGVVRDNARALGRQCDALRAELAALKAREQLPEPPEGFEVMRCSKPIRDGRQFYIIDQTVGTYLRSDGTVRVHCGDNGWWATEEEAQAFLDSWRASRSVCDLPASEAEGAGARVATLAHTFTVTAAP